jgi:TonB family protein
MIPRSAAVAAAAILVSLLLHFFGLGVMVRVQPEGPPQDAATDVVTVGNAFEDVAETLSEPLPPEMAPVPEPPRETQPEQDIIEPRTSEALVQSSEPERVFAPDGGGTDAAVEPIAAEPAIEPSTPPTSRPAAQEDPAEAPATLEPVRPEASSPAPPAVPAILLEPETVQTALPEIAVEPVPEEQETATTDDAPERSALAVVTSPRPPDRRQPADRATQDDGPSDFRDLRNPPLMESPLAAYQRDRSDVEVRQTGKIGFLGPGGSGNSDVTNYAGRVLAHLNRAGSGRVSSRGAAWVHFEINPDGSLARVDIIDSTGSLELETAAKAQVRKAAPFPRPPEGARRTLTFIYSSN